MKRENKFKNINQTISQSTIIIFFQSIIFNSLVFFSINLPSHDLPSHNQPSSINHLLISWSSHSLVFFSINLQLPAVLLFLRPGKMRWLIVRERQKRDFIILQISQIYHVISLSQIWHVISHLNISSCFCDLNLLSWLTIHLLNLFR